MQYLTTYNFIYVLVTNFLIEMFIVSIHEICSQEFRCELKIQ